MTRPHSRHGFTLIELLVVVALLGVLMAIVLPQLMGSRESVYRTMCANNLRQFHMGVTSLAIDEHGVLPSAYDGEVQVSLERATVNRLAREGLGVEVDGIRQPGDTLQCPADDDRITWNDVDDALTIGYQYMGGIEEWQNQQGVFDSRSPVRFDRSPDNWMLAADASMREGGAWTRLQHVGPEGGPAGQNQVYVDGGVRWVNADELALVHSWSPGTVQLFMHQEELGDFVPTANDMLRNFYD